MVQFNNQAEDLEVLARTIKFGTIVDEAGEDIIKAGDLEVDLTGKVEAALEVRRPGWC